MDFLNKKCIPCEGGIDPLNKIAVKKMLADVSGWDVQNGRLHKEFKFKNFIVNMQFH